MNNIICCGIDIGTTTLSAVVLDVTQKKQLASYTVEHKAGITTENLYEHIQDADLILKLACELVDQIIEKYPSLSAIGFTGQMHGILYIDTEGKACSPLYTWQDNRGDLKIDDETYCERIKRITNRSVATGYGFVTHYYNFINSIVPEKAVSFCSIMDYVAIYFSENKKAICHPSVAASFGLYDIEKNNFDIRSIEMLGMSDLKLPCVLSEDTVIGHYKGIDIVCAIGDNQASIFGSLSDEDDSVLVNYGTGSQISVVSDITTAEEPLEVRPYIAGRNIVCGCALCGGYAFEVLERFFAGYAQALGINDSQYKIMDTLAKKAFDDGKKPLDVSTMFKGSRLEPYKRGSIKGISADDFTPQQLILGVIYGMVNELHGMYKISGIKDQNLLVASGNGVRKNPVLQNVLSDEFNMKLLLLDNKEEAATGAAMYSAYCLGHDIDEVKKCICYKNE